jgi:hypothetical protein
MPLDRQTKLSSNFYWWGCWFARSRYKKVVEREPVLFLTSSLWRSVSRFFFTVTNLKKYNGDKLSSRCFRRQTGQTKTLFPFWPLYYCVKKFASCNFRSSCCMRLKSQNGKSRCWWCQSLEVSLPQDRSLLKVKRCIFKYLKYSYFSEHSHESRNCL